MYYDRFIWDFNGTILDDVSACIESANELLARYGLEPMKTLEKYYSVFGFPIIDYYKRIGFDFDKVDYSVLAHEWVDIYLEKVKKAPLRDGVEDTVKKIKELGIKQTILSMTESEMLKRQVEMLGISDLFDEIIGKKDIYASEKLALAGACRENHKSEKLLYIGDTTHDAESAKIIGADCVMLSGGHESYEVLRKNGNEIITNVRDLLSLVYRKTSC